MLSAATITIAGIHVLYLIPTVSSLPSARWVEERGWVLFIFCFTPVHTLFYRNKQGAIFLNNYCKLAVTGQKQIVRHFQHWHTWEATHSLGEGRLRITLALHNVDTSASCGLSRNPRDISAHNISHLLPPRFAESTWSVFFLSNLQCVGRPIGCVVTSLMNTVWILTTGRQTWYND